MHIPLASRMGGNTVSGRERAASVADAGETSAMGRDAALPDRSLPQLGQREAPAGTLLSHEGQRYQVESYRMGRSIPEGPAPLTGRGAIRPTTQRAASAGAPVTK
jgi:hypothetical protein